MRIVLAAALTLGFPLHSLAQTEPSCSIEFPHGIEEPVWLEGFDTCHPDIRKFIEHRIPGLEFYGPALEQFSQFSHAEQLTIIERFFQKTDDHEALKMDLAVPLSLIEAILLEAVAEGADTDWDIPAFEEVLLELREDGETESGGTFTALRQFYAPKTTQKIYFVFAKEESERRLEAAQERLEAAQERLEAVQERRADAQERLEAAQEQLRMAQRLEVAQERLRAAQERLRVAEERRAAAQETVEILKDAVAATQGN